MQNAMQPAALGAQHFANFVFAGRAVFTVQRLSNGARITYRIKEKRYSDKTVHLVFANILGDGDAGEQFLGTVYNANTGNPTFYWSKTKSRVPQDAPAVLTIAKIVANYRDMARFLDKVAIYHEGRCCRCGRDLTVPSSIISGIGPECARKQAVTGVAAAGQTKRVNPHYQGFYPQQQELELNG